MQHFRGHSATVSNGAQRGKLLIGSNYGNSAQRKWMRQREVNTDWRVRWGEGQWDSLSIKPPPSPSQFLSTLSFCCSLLPCPHRCHSHSSFKYYAHERTHTRAQPHTCNTVSSITDWKLPQAQRKKEKNIMLVFMFVSVCVHMWGNQTEKKGFDHVCDRHRK